MGWIGRSHGELADCAARMKDDQLADVPVTIRLRSCTFPELFDTRISGKRSLSSPGTPACPPYIRQSSPHKSTSEAGSTWGVHRVLRGVWEGTGGGEESGISVRKIRFHIPSFSRFLRRFCSRTAFCHP